jgi:hypothetical protein
MINNRLIREQVSNIVAPRTGAVAAKAPAPAPLSTATTTRTTTAPSGGAAGVATDKPILSTSLATVAPVATTTPIIVFTRATEAPAYTPSSGGGGGGGGGGAAAEEEVAKGGADTKVEFFSTNTGKVVLAFTGLLLLAGGVAAYKRYNKK